MFTLTKKFHLAIYIGALVLTVVSLPYSIFILSIAQITLVINWFVEGDFVQKRERFKQHPALWIIFLFYLVHLLGMLYTSDFDWGVHDLRIKLPFFVLPLVIGTSTPINLKNLKLILNFFIAAVLVNSMISACIFWGFEGHALHTSEQLSPFVSHIRWSLMVDLSIITMFWLFNHTESRYKWLYMLVIIWFIVYIFILQVLTGVVVLIVTSLILLIRTVFKNRNLMYRWFVTVALLTLTLLIASFLTRSYARFFTFDKIDPQSIDKYTVRGNSYNNDFTKKYVENGHYTYLYICVPELREAWQKRSTLDLYGKAKNKGELSLILCRYLTSKGLRKDSGGVSHLSDREIKYIESGITNCIDTMKYSFYPKIYQVIWELYNYKIGANPSGYSVAQRFEYVKTAAHIIRNNFWFGVGTGDIREAFKQQYITDKSQLIPEKRLRTHNQLITFWVTFGIVGLAILLFSLIAPPILEKKYSDYLFLTIFIIAFLSFLNEDTLETHAGISFIAVFYTLFLFYDRKQA
jgi:O-antigen ligase